MRLALEGLSFYGVACLGPLAAFSWSRRIFPQPPLAWVMARLLGWAVPAFFAWLFGLLGVSHWVWVGLPLVLAGVVASAGSLGAVKGEILPLELLGLTTFWAWVLARAPNFPITGTEKPMDLAILASLSRPQPLPPEDPWLAGYSLAYYHWGFLPWLLPGKLLGLFPDELYNLLVPALAAMVVQLAFAWARSWGLGFWPSLAAAGSCVFLGTAQGWSQVFLDNAGFASADLWQASRGIAHAITEFPLFTYHLGDLHPHLLCQPWVLGALVAWELGLGFPRLPLTGFFFGVAAATNPWAAPPLALTLGALGLAKNSLKGATQALGACLGGGLLFLPAARSLPTTPLGLGLVHTPTTIPELLQVLSPTLLLPLAAALALVPLGWTTTTLLAGTSLALLSHRPLLGTAAVLALLMAGLARKEPELRAPAAVVAAAMVLLAGMELFYLRDPYGDDWYRMNTVFKTLSFVFLVLPVPAWRLLVQPCKIRGVWLLLLGLAPWLLSLPQLATVVRQAWPPPSRFAGLGWMADGEAAAARFLQSLPGREVLVEAVGDAYSDAARLSAASGVPTVLGWENHEQLWRGPAIGQELHQRRLLVRELYLCSQPRCGQELAHKLGASILVLGSLERRLYPSLQEEALRQAGEVIFQQGQVTLIRFSSP